MGASTMAIGFTAASAGMNAYSSLQQGSAQAGQAKYQAAVARNNRILALRAAQDARERGEMEASRQREATDQAVSRSRAEAAARGVVVDQGSARHIAESITEIGEIDALTIRANAEREAVDLERQAQGFEQERKLEGYAARNAKTQGRIGAFGSLLSGGAQVANKWYAFKDAGAM